MGNRGIHDVSKLQVVCSVTGHRKRLCPSLDSPGRTYDDVNVVLVTIVVYETVRRNAFHHLCKDSDVG